MPMQAPFYATPIPGAGFSSPIHTPYTDPCELPSMPEEPRRPGLFASREEKANYQYNLSVYNQLAESYQRLYSLYGEMFELRNAINLVQPADQNPVVREGNAYRITCPYCLKKYSVTDLLFRAAAHENAAGKVVDSFQMEPDEKFANHWDSVGYHGGDPIRGHVLNMDPAAREIRTITFAIDDVGGKETIPYDQNARHRMAYQRVLYVEDRFNNRTSTRLCPECHTDLPADIGFIPNYVYSLMGNSSCGKTVYLNRLILTLTSGQFMNGRIFAFPMGEDITKETMGESITEYAKTLFRTTNQSLAEATDVAYIPPIILRLQDNFTMKRYFITLFDYPGEAIWKEDPFFDDLAKRVRQNSSGLIMMFDSGTLLKDFIRPELQSTADNEYGMSQVDQILAKIYSSAMGADSAYVPVALVMTKSDLIAACGQHLNGIVFNGMPSFLSPAVPHDNPNLPELYRCHREVEAFVGHFNAPAVLHANGMFHGDYAWFGVSSTGVPLIDGVIPENTAVAGLRETDPLEWLLYRNGHLQGNFNGAPDDNTAKKSVEWAAAFQKQNYAKLRDLSRIWWGDPGDVNCPGEIRIFNQLKDQLR